MKRRQAPSAVTPKGPLNAQPAPALAPPPAEPPDRSVITLIRELQAGRVSGVSLGQGERRRVVEHLTADGYSCVEIAEVLKISDRTIERDRQAVRESHALEADPALVPRMVGQLVSHAEQTVGRLRRIARDRETPAAVKVEAERCSWGVSRELVVTLQRLGYLPTAPQEFRGEITSQSSLTLEAPGYDEIVAELGRLESIVTSRGEQVGAPLGALTEIKDAVARLSVQSKLKQLSGSLRKDASHEHDDHRDGDTPVPG